MDTRNATPMAHNAPGATVFLPGTLRAPKPPHGLLSGNGPRKTSVDVGFPFGRHGQKGTRLTAVRPRMEGDYGLENSQYMCIYIYENTYVDMYKI